MVAESSFCYRVLAPLAGHHHRSQQWEALHPWSDRLIQQLELEGLAPLWSDLTAKKPGAFGLSPADVAALDRSRRAAAGRYLLQHRAASRLCSRLTDAGIRNAVFKGVALRERLYADPALRTADDIDILVSPQDLARALKVLVAEGLRSRLDRRNLSHEMAFGDGLVTIDLHWSLLRPGRSRSDLTPVLLETAHSRGSLSALSDDASLLVMLVHPAFTKHVNGRRAGLIRVVDLDRMLRITEPNWDWILPRLDASGLRTAAWAVLHWQRTVIGSPVDAAVLRHLEPGRLQRRYLGYWIDRELPRRLGWVPGLVQGAFTLALHDRPRDALRAIRALATAVLESGRELRRLQGLIESAGD